jgi:hypothetical protein
MIPGSMNPHLYKNVKVGHLPTSASIRPEYRQASSSRTGNANAASTTEATGNLDLVGELIMNMTMQRIEIFDVDEAGALVLDLRDVLKLVERYRDLRWYFLELEATGKLRGNETIVELERRIAQNPHGLGFDWNELTTLADDIAQTINTTLVGCRPATPPPALPLRPREGLEIAIEAIDSSLWAVSTNESAIILQLKAAFKNTKLETWTG